MSDDLHAGDCRAVLPALAADSFDSVCTDPPYELDFMGKSWDRTGVAFDPETWRAVLRVLKPGGYVVAFGGTRTYHRLTCAIEDAGLEVRDCLMWLYGTGFPKGRGCLKPAWEPIVLARKPGKRVLPLGVDACRVPLDPACNLNAVQRCKTDQGRDDYRMNQVGYENPTYKSAGRYPANVLHDGSDEVMEAFAAFGERGGGPGQHTRGGRSDTTGYRMHHETGAEIGFADAGTAARFFYCAKASQSERGQGNTHPTVKPLALMRWLVRLVTPPGGTVLDSFAGSGTTLLAARDEGRRAVGIELDAGHCEIIRKRLAGTESTGLLAGVA